MKASLASTLFFLCTLVHLCPIHANPSPEEQEYIDYCIEKYGPDTIITPNTGGGYSCVNCAGSAYTDPKSGDRKCCGLHDKFTTDQYVKTEGACCRPPSTFSYDPAAKAGSCCGPSQVFKGGVCTTPTGPPPPAHRCDSCTKDFACACDGHLGIRYGHCYTLTDVNGLQLNRDTGGTYQSGGDVGNLIFRVCKTTADCDESQGQYVPEDGSWSLQDQLGARNLKGPGWFGKQAPHMGVAAFNTPQSAAIFTAEGFCMFGDCALCLRLKEAETTGLSAPCPLGGNAKMAHIGRATNPNNCKAYRFQEIKCMKGVPSRP